MDRYDVAVIGGGPGGYVCAVRCAQEGLKTVLVEQEYLGGTCLNAGCIPTKALLESAKVLETARKSAVFGVRCGDPVLDFAAVMKRKDDIVGKLRLGIEGLVRGNGCTLLKGQASFSDAHTLEIRNDGEARCVRFESAVIATGSVPSVPPFEGLEQVPCVDSDGFLAMDSLPERAVIIGAGVIGMEFCTFLHSAGCQVAMLDLLPEILAGTDGEIARALRESMERKGVAFHLSARVERFATENGAAVCCFSKNGAEEKVRGDLIVLAAGRRPRTQGLNLEQIGVAGTPRGFIRTDNACRTSLPHLFAVGDVNGKSMLAHAASAQGMAVAKTLSGGDPVFMDCSVIPSCIYTEPEIAWAGLTEAEAREKGGEISAGRFSASGNGKSMIIGATEGFAKVIAEKTTGEILGLHLFCAHATDMIGEGVLALQMESTLRELGGCVHPHPTVNEMLMEAAHSALGHCAHQVRRASGENRKEG